MPRYANRLGRAGEEAAAQHLLAHGALVVARNWRTRLGELDLVALEGETVVFVEVKSRSSHLYGRPAEAVDPRKQARIARLARAFLQERHWLERPCRFDVIAVEPPAGRGTAWQITWIRDAFRPMT